MAGFSLLAILLSLVLPTSGLAQGAEKVLGNSVQTEALVQTAPVIGRLVARQAGNISARVAGPVAAVMVDVGDPVEGGEIIALIDATLLVAERDLRAAEREAAEASVNATQAELTIARQQLNRLEGLRNSAAFSQARYDDQRQEVVRGQAALVQEQARMNSSAAELALAEANLAYAQIRASYSGVVTQKLTSEGAYLRIGDPVVAMISDAQLEIEADVPFKLIPGLASGMEVAADLGAGRSYLARLRAVVPEENPLTRTRAVRFELPASLVRAGLAPGQSATLQVPVGQARDVLSVHKDALIPGVAGSTVFVAAPDPENEGQFLAERRRVEVGEALGTRYEVLSGLEEGDIAVTRGNERLRPGQSITVEVIEQ